MKLIANYSVYMMKAKAEAEAKQMQMQGMKKGEDFVDCKLISWLPLPQLRFFFPSFPCLPLLSFLFD